MVDIRQSLPYANYLKRGGWVVERKDKINYFIRKFPIIGSILKLQRPGKIDYQFIDELVMKYRVFQLIVEPTNESQVKSLSKNGFKLSKSPYLPSKTLQIDLTQNQKTIFSHFKKDAQYAIRKSYDSSDSHRTNGGYQITNHSYSTEKDIKKWRDAWKDSVKFDRYVPSYNQLINLRKSFLEHPPLEGKNNSLFLASHNISGSIIGGALFTRISHGVAYYWYGFTNKEGRSSLSQYSLLYQGILWGKKMGCKTFDFEGIYDSRFPNKSWLGFSHFKKSFGGIEVLYPGCYTKLKFPFSTATSK